MSLTVNIFLLMILLISGIIISIIKKNKLLLIISWTLAALLICFTLFLIFMLIPSM